MEQIKINDRLMTAIPFVREDRRFADIGTDHAYLPIFLINNGSIHSAIAADINKGPLDKALENIKKYSLEDKVSTVLCDGLTKIDPTLVDDIAIFGMGGELIVKIIDEASWLRDVCADKRLILQPMTHPEKLREYLSENGYRIIGETLSLDRGKIYQTICAEYDGMSRKFDTFTLFFGEHIIMQGGELFNELLLSTHKKLIRKIEGKSEGNEDVSYENELLANIEKYIKR